MKIFAYIVLLVCTSVTYAQVAFDAYGDTTLSSTTNFSWLHTPVGTPAYAAVTVTQTSASVSDQVSGVTWGGTAMTELTGSPLVKASGEHGVVYVYQLTSSIPTGEQRIIVTVTGADAKIGNSITLTAGGNTETVDIDVTVSSDSDDNPSVTLSLGGRTSFAYVASLSGQNDPSGTTPFANWNSREEFDFGTKVGFLYTFDTIGTTDVTAGYTQTAEDAVMIAVAVSQVVAGGATPNKVMIVE